MLFPKGDTGRIPLIAVAGTRGRNTTARLVAHLLRATNRVIGLVTTHRVMVGDRCSDLPGQSESEAARCLLLNPIVEAAVFCVGAETIGREGLGFDRCEVGIITSLGPVETLPMHGMETLENRVRLDRSVVDVVLPHGVAVLNAEDPLVVEMASACKGSVIFVSREPQSPAEPLIVAPPVAACLSATERLCWRPASRKPA